MSKTHSLSHAEFRLLGEGQVGPWVLRFETCQLGLTAREHGPVSMGIGTLAAYSPNRRTL